MTAIMKIDINNNDSGIPSHEQKYKVPKTSAHWSSK